MGNPAGRELSEIVVSLAQLAVMVVGLITTIGLLLFIVWVVVLSALGLVTGSG